MLKKKRYLGDETVVYPIIKEIAVKTANIGDSFLRVKNGPKVKTFECGTIRDLSLRILL